MSKIFRSSDVDGEGKEIVLREQFETEGQSDDSFRTKEQVEAELEKLKEKARLEAEEIVAQAKADRDKIATEAQETGFQKGYNDGLTAGKSEANRLRLEAQEVLDQAKVLLKETVAETEPKIIDLAVEITTKLIQVQLELSPQQIKIIAQEALQKVKGGKNYIIHVNPKDAEVLRSNKELLLQELPGNVTLRIIVDQQITPGGCLVDTEQGQIEATIDGQLDRVKKTLLGRKKVDS